MVMAYPSVELPVEARKPGAADYQVWPVALDDPERPIREASLKGKGGHQEGGAPDGCCGVLGRHPVTRYTTTGAVFPLRARGSSASVST